MNSEMGRIIWETSRADEGSISVTGADIIAAALDAAGFGKVEPCPLPHWQTADEDGYDW